MTFSSSDTITLAASVYQYKTYNKIYQLFSIVIESGDMVPLRVIIRKSI